MFKSNYIDEWRLLNKLSVDWPYSQEEVYQALEQEHFSSDGTRAYCHHPTNSILKDILDSTIKQAPTLLVELCEQDYFISELWRVNHSEQITNNTVFEIYFVRDDPGFTTSIHIDGRITVCTGMLFFNSFDDPDQSTTFYTNSSAANPVRISSQYGNGWFSANTHDSWHIGGNNSSRSRYSLMLLCRFNLK